MEDVSSRGALQHAGQGDTGVPQQPSGQQQQQQQHAHPQQGAGGEHQHCQELLAQRDAQIELLQNKLEHYRAWLSSLQGQMQHKDPQVVKNARRLYIGGIPEGARETELRQFFDGIMNSTGASCGPGSSIVTCKISTDKSYAFLELRSVEEASNAMAFDGVVFKDTNLKIRRPSNYSASDAIGLGPVTPDPTIDTSGLEMCKTVVEDTWKKIFIGGLPCHYTDDQVKELLAPYGALKSFNLVMDKNTGKSKGYAFCEFADPQSIPEVISGLHMHTLERKVLTVKRALEGTRQGGGTGGRVSAGTPLGGQGSGGLPGGPSSSGSSRGALQPPPPPGAMAAMRSGSYSSGSQQQQQQQQQGGGHPRMSGRGGSGSASPMHGGHRFSPHHPQHAVFGSPGQVGDPFGPGPHHHMMPGPGPHHPTAFGVGYYMAAEVPASGAMFGPGIMGPAGPMHGWPTHGMFGPGPGPSSGRGMPRPLQQQQQPGFGSGSWGPAHPHMHSPHHPQHPQQHQQQQGTPPHRGSSSSYAGGSSRFGGSYPSEGSRGQASAAAAAAAGGAAGGHSDQSPETPSPVPPTPGASTDNMPSTLSPGIGGGAVTAAAALSGVTSSGSEVTLPVGHSSSGTGSSSMYQPSGSMGSGSGRQRPSDAGSSHTAEH